MIDDAAQQVAQLIAERRERVASTAMAELQQASMQELPDLVHRLAGKLAVFGHPDAGQAARELMLALRDRVDADEVSRRVADIVALLTPRLDGAA